ncbi:hypothetical protein DFP81_102394 [Marinomonas pollencensis]|uniref:Uncharacterized protein n=1 Tax=Marinomonas pollencensis TaxID=491954 RepID=A0A3E0DRT4_9GAMM|nr:hypothetical protein DFP81_102394 [Marinomonas pollencensis]
MCGELSIRQKKDGASVVYARISTKKLGRVAFNESEALNSTSSMIFGASLLEQFIEIGQTLKGRIMVGGMLKGAGKLFRPLDIALQGAGPASVISQGTAPK